jgi:hypothetical protein
MIIWLVMEPFINRMCCYVTLPVWFLHVELSGYAGWITIGLCQNVLTCEMFWGLGMHVTFPRKMTNLEWESLSHYVLFSL